jgi:hypothetical protein
MLPFLPSAVLALLAFALFLPRRLFAQRATRSDGTVVAYAERFSRSRRHRHRRFHPVVEYVVGEERHRITSPVGEARQRWPIGTPVTVLYDPAKPGAGVIDAVFDLYFGAIVAAIVSVVALVCAFGALFTER